MIPEPKEFDDILPYLKHKYRVYSLAIAVLAFAIVVMLVLFAGLIL